MTDTPHTEPKYKATLLDSEVFTMEEVEKALDALDNGRTLDGADPIGDNHRRAHFAAIAMLAYAQKTGVATSETAFLAVQDFLGDLQHLLDAMAGLDEDDGYGRTLESLIDGASVHYEAEIRGVL